MTPRPVSSPSAATPQGSRAGRRPTDNAADGKPGLTRWRSVTLQTATGAVPARVIEPTGLSVGWLVWAHGGSWSRGSVEQWHVPCAELAALGSCTVVSVEYRLAPQHSHPAPLEDVLTALDWVQTQIDTQADAGTGSGPSKVAVGGDSAGGTLAACAALTWRDRCRPLAGQVLAYPPLDPACQSASYRHRPDEFPTRMAMIAAWRAHRGLGRGAARYLNAEYTTPFEATNLTGTAPAVLAVGSHDPVADDVREYARRLAGAQVPVLLREFEDTGHGAFLTPSPGTDPVAGQPQLREWLGSAVRELLDPSVPAPTGEYS